MDKINIKQFLNLDNSVKLEGNVKDVIKTLQSLVDKHAK